MTGEGRPPREDRMRIEWLAGLAVVSALAAARADDSGAAPPAKHVSQVTPEAQAAIERFGRIAYRPQDHGMQSVKGSVVPFGFKTRDRLEFDLAAPDFVNVRIPSAIDREMRSADFWTWTAKDALYLAFDAPGMFEYDEMDASIVVRDGVTVIEATEYTDDKVTSTDEFSIGAEGLPTRRVHRAANGSDAPNYTQTYSWTKVGDQDCVSGMEIRLDEEKSNRYVCSLEYSDVAGIRLVTSFAVEYTASGAAPRTFTFRIADLVVNGAPANLPAPWRHVNHVTPEAKAAIERMRGLSDRPADRGLKSFAGEVVAVGWQTKERTTFAFTAPDQYDRTIPAALRDEMSRLHVESQIVAGPVGLGVSPEWIEFDELDAEVADRDGTRTILVAEFNEGELVRRREYATDAAGLVARQQCRSATGQHGDDYTSTYTWSKSANGWRLTGVDKVFEDEHPQSYSSSIEYASVGGFELPVSWTVTYALDPKTMKRFRFFVDAAVVNGVKADLPRPWIHERRVSPEAKAMLDRWDSLVYRPTDHGLASASLDLVAVGTRTPTRTTFEIAPPSHVAVTRHTGLSTGPGDPRIQSIALGVAVFGIPFTFADDADMDVAERGGVRVLVVTAFRDGLKMSEVEVALDDEELPAALTVHDVSESGDPSVTMTLRPVWSAAGAPRRVDKLTTSVKLPNGNAEIDYTFHRAEIAGFDLPTSVDSAFSSVPTGVVRCTFRVENVVVNGKAVDVPAPPSHVNRVTPEAQAAIDRFEGLVWRPADHGFTSVEGEFVAGDDAVARRHRFVATAPAFVSVTLANGFDQDSPAGIAATAALGRPLRMAYVTVAMVGPGEFDAERVTKGGRDVVTATLWRDGARSEEQELTLDANGLIAESRVRTYGASGQVTSILDSKFTWGPIGDRWRVESLDVVRRPPLDPSKWLVRTATTLRYADVGGVQVLAAMRICESTAAGPPSIYQLHVAHLVLNGKPVELPRPVHANRVTDDAQAAIGRYEKLVYRPADHGLVSASGVYQPLALTFEVKPPARLEMAVTPGEKPGSPRTGMQMAIHEPLACAFGGPLLHSSDAYDASFEDRAGARVLVVTDFVDDLPTTRREVTFGEEGLVLSMLVVHTGPFPAQENYRYAWKDGAGGRLVASDEVRDGPDPGAPEMTVAFVYTELGGVLVPTSIAVSFKGGKADGKSLAFGLAEAVVNGTKFVATPKAPDAPPPAPGSDGK
jgi:hypothetical protein